MLRRSWFYTQTKVGAGLTVAVLLVALVGPFLASASPTGFAGAPFSSPGSGAPLGTDVLGRDVLSRALHGGVFVVWSSIAAAMIAMVLGAGLGLVAGQGRAATDSVIMRGFDVVLAFPQLVIVLLFVALIGTHLWLIVTLTGVALAPGVARVTRGMTRDVVSRDFVRSAELLGAARSSILLREVLPNLSSALLVEFTTRLVWAVSMIAGLSFLGFGPSAANWGLMISENRTGLPIQPFAVAVPVALLAAFATGTGLIADGVGRALARIEAGART